MPEPRDLIARLESIGRTEPTPPSPDRLAIIESRVIAATGEPAVPVTRRRVVSIVLTAAAVVLLVVVLAVGAAGRGRGEVTFADADGVVLEYPGDRFERATTGDEVPDGVVVDIAPGGEAMIGTTRYGPGRYVVDDGRLVALGGTTAGTTTSPTTSPTTTVHRPTTGLLESDATTTPATSDTPSIRPVTTAGPTRTTAPARTTTIAPPIRTTIASPPARPSDRPVIDPVTTTSSVVASSVPSERDVTPATSQTTTTLADSRRG